MRISHGAVLSVQLVTHAKSFCEFANSSIRKKTLSDRDVDSQPIENAGIPCSDGAIRNDYIVTENSVSREALSRVDLLCCKPHYDMM